MWLSSNSHGARGAERAATQSYNVRQGESILVDLEPAHRISRGWHRVNRRKRTAAILTAFFVPRQVLLSGSTARSPGTGAYVTLSA